MLVWLIFIFSLFNMALAYHAAQLFRRDQSRRIRHQAMLALKAVGQQSADAASIEVSQEETTESETEVHAGEAPVQTASEQNDLVDSDPSAENPTALNSPVGDPPVADATAPEVDVPSTNGDSEADIIVRAKTMPASAEPPPEPLAEAKLAEQEPVVQQPSPSAINPSEQPLVEELYYQAAELVNDLSEIDHSVVAGQAGEAPTEELLADMSPRVAKKIEPIESLLLRIADELPDLEAAASEIVAQCRRLIDEMGTVESRETNSESGMHLLRDLFTTACNFRNDCEDALVLERGIDHRHSGGQGQVAFEHACNVQSASEKEHCAIGVEIDHLRELNSMYGAVAVNAILDQLPAVIAGQLPKPDQVYRRHGQHFMALYEGDITSATAAADGIRRQIGTTKFCFHNEPIEATLSAAIVPLEVGSNNIVARIATALAEAKARGENHVAADHGDRVEVAAGEEGNVEPMEVIVAS